MLHLELGPATDAPPSPLSPQDDTALHLELEPHPLYTEAEVVECSTQLRNNPELLNPTHKSRKANGSEAEALVMGRKSVEKSGDSGSRRGKVARKSPAARGAEADEPAGKCCVVS